MPDIVEFFIPLFFEIQKHWAFGYINRITAKVHVFNSLRSDATFVEAKKRLLQITAVEYPDVLFECVQAVCPQQSNGVDCGVFSLMFMIMCSQGKDVNNIQQKYMNYFRKYLAVKLLAIDSGAFMFSY